MIVVDSSAVIAIMLKEETRRSILECLGEAEGRSMSVANYVEAATVWASRSGLKPGLAQATFEDTIALAQIQLISVDVEQSKVAINARIRFGKGFGHPAQLNYGDCFAYALAKKLKAPLLYVGQDFIHTDIQPALAAA